MADVSSREMHTAMTIGQTPSETTANHGIDREQ